MADNSLPEMPVTQHAALFSALQVQPAQAAQPQPEPLTPYMQGELPQRFL
jgi:hypothetical protein